MTDIPEYPIDTKTAIISSANLLVKGLVMSVDDGVVLTTAGIKRGTEVWNSLSDDDKFLLVAMFKRMFDKEDY
jgi:hypothetical protein